MDELSKVLYLVSELWFQFKLLILPRAPVFRFQPLHVPQLKDRYAQLIGSSTALNALHFITILQLTSKTPREKSQELTAHPLCKLPQTNCTPTDYSAP